MDQQAMKQHGAFSWNELMTTDIAGAKRFYHDLLGWELVDQQMPELTYTLIKAGDSEIGGMMANPPDAKGMPPAWGTYITVDDVDSQMPKVERLGGKVLMPPRDIPEVGRFAVISDPQGAMLTLITYNC